MWTTIGIIASAVSSIVTEVISAVKGTKRKDGFDYDAERERVRRQLDEWKRETDEG